MDPNFKSILSENAKQSLQSLAKSPYYEKLQTTFGYDFKEIQSPDNNNMSRNISPQWNKFNNDKTFFHSFSVDMSNSSPYNPNSFFNHNSQFTNTQTRSNFFHHK